MLRNKNNGAVIASATGVATVRANEISVVDLKMDIATGDLVVNVCLPGNPGENSITINPVFSAPAPVNGRDIVRTGGDNPPQDLNFIVDTTGLPHAALEEGSNIYTSVTIDTTTGFLPSGGSAAVNEAYAIDDDNQFLIAFNGETPFSLSGCSRRLTLERIGLFNHGIKVSYEVPVSASGTLKDAQGNPHNVAGGSAFITEINRLKVALEIRFPVVSGLNNAILKENRLKEMFDQYEDQIKYRLSISPVSVSKDSLILMDKIHS